MKYPHIFMITLALIALFGFSAFAQSMNQDMVSSVEPDTTKVTSPAAGKKASTKISGRTSKRKASSDNTATGETIVFPKVSKVEKPTDDWETNSPEHSGRTRGGNGNRPMFR